MSCLLLLQSDELSKFQLSVIIPPWLMKNTKTLFSSMIRTLYRKANVKQ